MSVTEATLSALVADATHWPADARAAQRAETTRELHDALAARQLGAVAVALAGLAELWSTEARVRLHVDGDAATASQALANWLWSEHLMRAAQRRLFRQQGRPDRPLALEELLQVHVAALWLGAEAIVAAGAEDIGRALADADWVDEHVTHPEYVRFAAAVSSAWGHPLDAGAVAPAPADDLYAGLAFVAGPAAGEALAAVVGERLRRSQASQGDDAGDDSWWYGYDAFKALMPFELLAYRKLLAQQGVAVPADALLARFDAIQGRDVPAAGDALADVRAYLDTIPA